MDDPGDAVAVPLAIAVLVLVIAVCVRDVIEERTRLWELRSGGLGPRPWYVRFYYKLKR